MLIAGRHAPRRPRSPAARWRRAHGRAAGVDHLLGRRRAPGRAGGRRSSCAPPTSRSTRPKRVGGDPRALRDAAPVADVPLAGATRRACAIAAIAVRRAWSHDALAWLDGAGRSDGRAAAVQALAELAAEALDAASRVGLGRSRPTAAEVDDRRRARPARRAGRRASVRARRRRIRARRTIRRTRGDRAARATPSYASVDDPCGDSGGRGGARCASSLARSRSPPAPAATWSSSRRRGARRHGHAANPAADADAATAVSKPPIGPGAAGAPVVPRRCCPGYVTCCAVGLISNSLTSTCGGWLDREHHRAGDVVGLERPIAAVVEERRVDHAGLDQRHAHARVVELLPQRPRPSRSRRAW